MANARKLTVRALCRVENDLAYSNLVLNELFSLNELSKNDKTFITALFYGVLDRKITLDYYINKLSKVRVNKMDPVTKQALRIGVYQIKFMDKIPESAAVNESVNIVKNSKEKKNANFVNAVLRNILRSDIELPDKNTLDYLSVVYSCPVCILREIKNDYGIHITEKIAESFLKPADVFIKINNVLIDNNKFIELLRENGISFEETAENGMYKVNGFYNISESNLYKKGYFHIQDISSKRCAESLIVKNNDRVLDVCAAPGGKTFTVAEKMNNSGEVIACDLYSSRNDLIKSGAERLKLDCIKTAVNDATVFNSRFGTFDAVLCDVPCSGWGVMRRKPEIKYKESSDFSSLEETQRKILSVSAKYVKNGGCLVYSTCTLRKHENEYNVADFLKHNSCFKLISQHTDFPFNNCDGFYHAVLVKDI